VTNKYVSTAEAAKRNGISRRYVQKLCVDGRIKGAMQVARDWLVPASFKWKPLPRGPKPRGKRD
jgi:excisionase family DNA binding protein